MENKYWLSFEEWKKLRNNMEYNKYYTPFIEEFHIGFECERTGLELPPQWHKYIVNTNTFIEPFFIGKKLGPSFRVKYLDEKDMRELGIIFTYQELGGDCTVYGTLRDTGIHILFSEEQVGLHKIPHIIIAYDDKQLFDGYIKNKSELKVLLKQLGINE